MCSGLFKRLSDCLLKDQPFVMQNFAHFNQYEIVLTFSLIIVYNSLLFTREKDWKLIKVKK